MRPRRLQGIIGLESGLDSGLESELESGLESGLEPGLESGSESGVEPRLELGVIGFISLSLGNKHVKSMLRNAWCYLISSSKTTS